jgi:hypothetical protein
VGDLPSWGWVHVWAGHLRDVQLLQRPDVDLTSAPTCDGGVQLVAWPQRCHRVLRPKLLLSLRKSGCYHGARRSAQFYLVRRISLRGFPVLFVSRLLSHTSIYMHSPLSYLTRLLTHGMDHSLQYDPAPRSDEPTTVAQKTPGECDGIGTHLDTPTVTVCRYTAVVLMCISRPHACLQTTSCSYNSGVRPVQPSKHIRRSNAPVHLVTPHTTVHSRISNLHTLPRVTS